MKAYDLARLLLRDGNYKVLMSMQPGNHMTAHHAVGAPEGAMGGVVYARNSKDRALFITNDVGALVRTLEADGVDEVLVVGEASECAKPECHKPDKGCRSCASSEAMCLARNREKGGKCCPDCDHESSYCGEHAYYGV